MCLCGLSLTFAASVMPAAQIQCPDMHFNMLLLLLLMMISGDQAVACWGCTGVCTIDRQGPR
jgi:hypothetical protein